MIDRVWYEPRYCDCDWCRPRGGKNNHAWAFYYFLKRLGDRPAVRVTKDRIIISIEDFWG